MFPKTKKDAVCEGGDSVNDRVSEFLDHLEQKALDFDLVEFVKSYRKNIEEILSLYSDWCNSPKFWIREEDLLDPPGCFQC